jgi:hypothetical protein
MGRPSTRRKKQREWQRKQGRMRRRRRQLSNQGEGEDKGVSDDPSFYRILKSKKGRITPIPTLFGGRYVKLCLVTPSIPCSVPRTIPSPVARSIPSGHVDINYLHSIISWPFWNVRREAGIQCPRLEYVATDFKWSRPAYLAPVNQHPPTVTGFDFYPELASTPHIPIGYRPNDLTEKEIGCNPIRFITSIYHQRYQLNRSIIGIVVNNPQRIVLNFGIHWTYPNLSKCRNRYHQNRHHDQQKSFHIPFSFQSSVSRLGDTHEQTISKFDTSQQVSFEW